ncbi:MAG TPA: hypothetical protein VHM91_06570 [Verrucomicrobiales bacterium]|nr:hypothetical protein [Verrucomicrobiales bacterium]
MKSVGPHPGLDHWTSGTILLSSVNNGDGTGTLTWLSPPATGARLYFQLMAQRVP